MNWEDELLQKLNPEQAEAVKQTEGPLLILAGAGSGKTNTIVHRIAWLIHQAAVKPWKIIAVTFTNKAAGEMLERTLQIAGPIASDCLIRTYHSLGLYLLRRYSHYIDYPGNFTIWDDTDQRGALELILKNNFSGKFNKTQVKYFAQSISSFKDRLIAPHELAEKEDLDNYEFGDILQDLYSRYEIRKYQSQAMDFADLLYQTVKIFRDFPEALQELHRKYTHFLVDEYQDTNHAQYTLIQLLAQQTKNLCVVGDDDQAIYGWRGADVSNILEFNQDFPDARIIKLEQNYRSTQPILTLANTVISINEGRMEKVLWTAKKDGDLPKLYTLGTDRDEANSIASVIENLKLSIPAEEIGVLYRTNTQSRLIEEALLNRNIPYRVYGGVSFFGRKEVKDALAYLQFIANPHDEVALLRLINTPSRGLGEKTLEKIFSTRAEKTEGDLLAFLRESESLGLSRKAADAVNTLCALLTDLKKKADTDVDLGLFLEDVLHQSGLRNMYEEEDRLLGTSRLENLLELKNSMINYRSDHPEGRLADYLQDISLYSNTEELDKDKAGVNLMTVHNAKGLEFRAVFVAGLDDDIFPHFLSKRDGDSSEERRLLYVAITRAKEKLYLTRCQTRFQQGWQQTMNPSPFLIDIPPDQLSRAQNLNRVGGGPWRQTPTSAPAKSAARKPAATGDFRNKVDFSAGTAVGGFKAGDRVKHVSFGNGRVLRIEGSGDAARIHIFFDDKKSRKFLLKFAGLEKI